SDNDKYLCYVNGEQWLVQEPVEDKEVFDEDEGMSLADKLQIKAPMPGKVIKILVKDSDEVKKNQTLVVVEAMKMENELKCSVDGLIKKVHVSEGMLVDVDKILIELEDKG
ncbi:MAG: acetyl-CoA carboxylase biotin carboxyl carrier protein subunit, partial [Acidobacteriota bacterium]